MSAPPFFAAYHQRFLLQFRSTCRQPTMIWAKNGIKSASTKIANRTRTETSRYAQWGTRVPDGIGFGYLIRVQRDKSKSKISDDVVRSGVFGGLTHVPSEDETEQLRCHVDHLAKRHQDLRAQIDRGHTLPTTLLLGKRRMHSRASRRRCCTRTGCLHLRVDHCTTNPPVAQRC